MLIAAHMVGHFESALTQVRKVPVETRVVDLAALRVRAPKVEQFTSVEASMRLDAVASAGFRTSRSKVADWIAKGDVRCVGCLVHTHATSRVQHQLEDDDQGERGGGGG